MADKLLKTREVMDMLGVARSTIYEKLRIGDFPTPIKLGVRDNRWRKTEIEAWVAGKENQM